MVLNPASVVDVKVDKLKLELDFLDVEAGSRGINISAGGKVDLKNIVIEASHADFLGISLHHLNQVFIKNIFMSGSQELIETTSIGKGLSMLNNKSLYLRNCYLVNFRFGIEIQDLADKSENRSAKIIDLSTEKC